MPTHTRRGLDELFPGPAPSLPDGSVPGGWETQPVWSRTYHVNQRFPGATDAGPGSADRPFRTINRAAEILRPGERVLVAPGVYREHVRPLNGGDGPDQMVGFQAEPGHQVVIRGSVVLPGSWERTGRQPGDGDAPVWVMHLPEGDFGEHNPFARENFDQSDPTTYQGATTGLPDLPANKMKRGLLFQEGRRLEQVPSYEDLLGRQGAYWVAEDGWTLHVRTFGAADPREVLMEATNRAQGFAPAGPGVSYLRLGGFVVEQAGNGFSYPVQAAVSPMGGHHWIIDGNIVRHVNADGVNIGSQIWAWGGDSSSPAGRHCIVRRNTIADCGVSGIKGLTPGSCLVEENLLSDIGWQSVERIYDNGGLKLLVCADLLVRRNVFRRILDAPGVWLDWDDRNCRVTENVFVDLRGAGGAIFLEASEQANWVDHNIVWGVQGNGIYQQDCDGQLVFANLVGCCSGDAVHMRVETNRQLHGRQVTCRGNRVLANTFVDNGRTVYFADRDNTAEGNLVADAAGTGDRAEQQPSELDGERGGGPARVAFDGDLLELELEWPAQGSAGAGGLPWPFGHGPVPGLT